MHRFHFQVPSMLKKDLNELYIANAIRSFAISTIAIFIPIFLLKEGFSFFHIGLYLLVNSLAMVFSSYLSMKVAAKLGVKKNTFISGPLIIIYFIILYNITAVQALVPDTLLISFLGFIMGMADSIYWTGFHVEFAKFSQAKKTAKQYGLVNISSTLCSASAPLIGAILITTFGFQVMFAIVMALLLVAIMPLFLSKEHHIPFKFTIKDATSKKNSSMVLPFFAEGYHHTALAFVWPIMLYLLFTEYNNVGGIYTLANALYVIATIFVSTRITEINRIIYLKIGTLLHSISIIVRLFVGSLTGMYAAMGYAGLSNAVMSNPYHSTFYNNTKKMGITTTIYLREFYLNLGRTASAMVMLILLHFVEAETMLAIVMFTGAVIVLFRGGLKEIRKTKSK